MRRRSLSGPDPADCLARLWKVLDKLEPNSRADAALEQPEPSGAPPPLTAPPERMPLQFPLRSPRRIAVLRRGFGLPPNAREFAASDLAGITAWEPDAVVASLNTALVLAGQKLGGQLALPSLQIAIAVVTSINDAPLADHHRDLLWRAFEVPVFELLTGWDGSVIARECEVHDGLHVDPCRVMPAIRDEELVFTYLTSSKTPLVLARTGYAAEILDGLCDCGLESARLRRLAPLPKSVAIA